MADSIGVFCAYLNPMFSPIKLPAVCFTVKDYFPFDTTNNKEFREFHFNADFTLNLSQTPLGWLKYSRYSHCASDPAQAHLLPLPLQYSYDPLLLSSSYQFLHILVI